MSNKNTENQATESTDVISNISHSPLSVKSVNMTCSACPSQWEGKLIDGRMYYVRYRWGCLSVSISKEPTDDVMDTVGGQEIHYSEPGDGFDGSMDTLTMKSIVKELSFEDCD